MNENNEPFLMIIEVVFKIEKRGVVVAGRVQQGVLREKEEIEIVGLGKTPVKTSNWHFEGFIKEMHYIVKGDNMGLLLKDVRLEQVQEGMTITKPNSTT